jgi:hypothetical protein
VGKSGWIAGGYPYRKVIPRKKDFANMGFPGLMKPLVEEYESISTS